MDIVPPQKRVSPNDGAGRSQHDASASVPPRMHDYLRTVRKETATPPLPPQAQRERRSETKRPRRLRRIALMLFGFVFLATLAVSSAAVALVMLPMDESATARPFEIAEGERIAAIAARLEKEGLIRHRLIFVLLLRFEGKETAVKAGSFALSPAMSPRRIVEIVTAPAPPERDLSVTIPEGFTLLALASRLAEAGIVADPEAFLSATIRVPAYSFLPGCAAAAGTASCEKRVTDLEGYLFPDTYRFRRNATPEDIVRKFLANFDEKFDADLRREAEAAGRSLADTVTMASLVEEEAKSDADRGIIAGILWKRLQLGMPLQVDATILYAKEQTAGMPLSDRTLRADDLSFASPYNTYLHTGLPPGPIANPGLKSLIAAVRPEASPYLFYLHTREGETIFSRTLEEHNAAKARYLSP